MADGTGAAVARACHTLTEIGFGSARAFIRQQEGIMGKWSCGVICYMNIFHSEVVCLPLCHGVDFDYRFTHTQTAAYSSTRMEMIHNNINF